MRGRRSLVRRYLLLAGVNPRLWFTVQIICKDGTTIQCQDFEAVDSGVLFYQQTPGRREGTEEEEGEEEERGRASGFVPVTELRFVLPDEMVQGVGAQRAAAEQGMPGGMGPGAPPQQGAGMAQQQQTQFPGSPSQRPPESGGR